MAAKAHSNGDGPRADLEGLQAKLARQKAQTLALMDRARALVDGSVENDQSGVKESRSENEPKESARRSSGSPPPPLAKRGEARQDEGTSRSTTPPTKREEILSRAKSLAESHKTPKSHEQTVELGYSPASHKSSSAVSPSHFLYRNHPSLSVSPEDLRSQNATEEIASLTSQLSATSRRPQELAPMKGLHPPSQQGQGYAQMQPNSTSHETFSHTHHGQGLSAGPGHGAASSKSLGVSKSREKAVTHMKTTLFLKWREDLERRLKAKRIQVEKARQGVQSVSEEEATLKSEIEADSAERQQRLMELHSKVEEGKFKLAACSEEEEKLASRLTILSRQLEVSGKGSVSFENLVEGIAHQDQQRDTQASDLDRLRQDLEVLSKEKSALTNDLNQARQDLEVAEEENWKALGDTQYTPQQGTINLSAVGIEQEMEAVTKREEYKDAVTSLRNVETQIHSLQDRMATSEMRKAELEKQLRKRKSVASIGLDLTRKQNLEGEANVLVERIRYLQSELESLQSELFLRTEENEAMSAQYEASTQRSNKELEEEKKGTDKAELYCELKSKDLSSAELALKGKIEEELKTCKEERMQLLILQKQLELMKSEKDKLSDSNSMFSSRECQVKVDQVREEIILEEARRRDLQQKLSEQQQRYDMVKSSPTSPTSDKDRFTEASHKFHMSGVKQDLARSALRLDLKRELVETMQSMMARGNQSATPDSYQSRANLLNMWVNVMENDYQRDLEHLQRREDHLKVFVATEKRRVEEERAKIQEVHLMWRKKHEGVQQLKAKLVKSEAEERKRVRAFLEYETVVNKKIQELSSEIQAKNKALDQARQRLMEMHRESTSVYGDHSPSKLTEEINAAERDITACKRHSVRFNETASQLRSKIEGLKSSVGPIRKENSFPSETIANDCDRLLEWEKAKRRMLGNIKKKETMLRDLEERMLHTMTVLNNTDKNKPTSPKKKLSSRSELAEHHPESDVGREYVEVRQQLESVRELANDFQTPVAEAQQTLSSMLQNGEAATQRFGRRADTLRKTKQLRESKLRQWEVELEKMEEAYIRGVKEYEESYGEKAPAATHSGSTLSPPERNQQRNRDGFSHRDEGALVGSNEEPGVNSLEIHDSMIRSIEEEIQRLEERKATIKTKNDERIQNAPQALGVSLAGTFSSSLHSGVTRHSAHDQDRTLTVHDLNKTWQNGAGVEEDHAPTTHADATTSATGEGVEASSQLMDAASHINFLLAGGRLYKKSSNSSAKVVVDGHPIPAVQRHLMLSQDYTRLNIRFVEKRMIESFIKVEHIIEIRKVTKKSSLTIPNRDCFVFSLVLRDGFTEFMTLDEGVYQAWLQALQLLFQHRNSLFYLRYNLKNLTSSKTVSDKKQRAGMKLGHKPIH